MDGWTYALYQPEFKVLRLAVLYYCRISTSLFSVDQRSKKSPGVFKAECSRTLFVGKKERDQTQTKSMEKTSWPVAQSPEHPPLNTEKTQKNSCSFLVTLGICVELHVNQLLLASLSEINLMKVLQIWFHDVILRFVVTFSHFTSSDYSIFNQ